MIRRWLTITLMALSFQVAALQDIGDLEASSSNYIRDDLFVFLHAGAGRNYRILGSIEAGTPITVLQHNREQEFSQVKDNEGRTGWVETRFISNTMSRAEQLPKISQKLADSQAMLQGTQSENSRLKQQLNDARQSVAKLTQQTEEQGREIKRLTSELDSADVDQKIKWLTRGGILAGACVLLGVLVTYLPKKRRRNDEWM